MSIPADSGNVYWYSYDLRCGNGGGGGGGCCGCGNRNAKGGFDPISTGRGCDGDTGVEIEGKVSAGEAEVSISMDKRDISRVLGLE